MTVTTPPSSNRTSSPIPFPSPSSSSSYPQYHPSHTPSRPSSATGTKRKQVKNACVNCQKACKKCDDQRPCSRCVKYGIEDGCINSQRKERKRKNHDEPLPSVNHNNTTRIQLNLSSTRTRAVEAPVPMRLSSRNGIRPFPKELLESLQHEEYDEQEGIDEDNNHGHHRNHSEHVHNINCNHSHSCYITPQVTEEFKTLAKICSDLHTVLSQQPQQCHSSQPYPLYNYRPINPFMMVPDNQHLRVHRSSYEVPRTVSPPPIIQRRSVSPTQLNQLNQLHQMHQIQQMTQFIQQHQHQQSTSQMLLKPSSPIYNTQQQQQQQVILRDLMNRTPPEEVDHVTSASVDDFPKQA